MRILADENIPRAIVVWLRDQGHDVLYAAESRSGTPDADLLSEAESDGYVISIENKDFGELVFRERRNSHGVIPLRLEEWPASRRMARLQAVWPLVHANLPGKFLVVSRTRMRFRPLTPP